MYSWCSKLKLLSIVATLCFLNSSCHANETQELEQSSKPKIHEIAFSGEISPETSNNLLMKLKGKSGPFILKIDSPGGDETAALDIAERLAESGYILVIKENCLSACANIIMLSAEKVFIFSDARVAFHTNIFGWLGVFHNTNMEEFNKNIPIGRRYSDLLKSRDIEPSLMSCIDRKHVRYGDVYYKKTEPTQKHKYEALYVDSDHLDVLGIDYEYLEGQKLSPKKSKYGLYDWDFKNCENYLNLANWGSVTHFIEKYSAPVYKMP